jgi:ElaB/YqjD/DUF883 family membrane-anchored ribosome-binding protein
MKNSRATATDDETTDTFLADLRALVTEAQKLLDASPDESNGETGSALRERFEAARDRFNEIYATAKKRVVDGGKYADQTIRANPYQSIAIAAGVGLLVGILVGRRGK